jgi:hypothetical protein
MKIYYYNQNNYEYIGDGIADPDPLDIGNWLLPMNATILESLPPVDGKLVKFINGEWVYENIPTIQKAPEPIAFEDIPYNYKRVREYPPITDYLDGIVKGDQAQIDQYIVDCLAVKAKYPKPE